MRLGIGYGINKVAILVFAWREKSRACASLRYDSRMQLPQPRQDGQPAKRRDDENPALALHEATVQRNSAEAAPNDVLQQVGAEAYGGGVGGCIIGLSWTAGDER